MDETTRERILRTIRKNLFAPEQRGVAKSREVASFEMQRSADRRRDVHASLLDIFEEELTLVGGNFKKVFSREELSASLCEICQKEKYDSIVVSREPIIEEVHVEELLRQLLPQSNVLSASAEDLINKLKNADVGITTCELLAAETGTIIIQSSSVSPRALSLLPRAHIVVVREEQLLPTVAACLEKLHSGAQGSPSASCITLITGPSRTADIEKVLVKGVHGPKALHVILMVGERS